MKETSRSLQFEFLPDSPIPADKKDDLHLIGLFGKWGTGKTTILNQLNNYLSDDYLLVTFDAWKYESDALRRSFILDISTQLKDRSILEDRFIKKAKERLYLDIARSREEFKFTWRSMILFLIVSAAVFSIQSSYVFLNLKSFSIVTLLPAFLSGGVAALSELIRSSVSVDKITVSEDKINSPEEFAEQFNTILDRVKNKNKRLIIAIDNLDRVDRDRAVELLGTVKTFLAAEEGKNCIFIIPCDDQSIREYLSSVYVKENENSEFDPDEFLRKFFNTVLRIPKFLNLELDSYTKSLLKQTKISKFVNNYDLEQIINQTFRENPREIKQFINNLIAYYLLALERVEAGEIDKSFIDVNLPFIAKLLIIRQKCPSQYNKIEEKVLREATSWEELVTSVLTNHSTNVLFSDLMGNGVNPSSSNIAVFMTLRRSKEERSLPGWDQFVDAAINKRTDAAAKIIKRMRL